MRLRTRLPTQLQEPADAAAAEQTMQRTRRDESTRVLCAGCTDAEARPPRRLARSQHTRHIGVTRDCSPTLVSKCQDCRPTGHHRFGFLSRRQRLDKKTGLGRTTQPLYQTLFQLVGNFHFPAEQSASFVTNHQRAAIFQNTCESFLIKMATTGTLTRSHDPPSPPRHKFVIFTPIRSVHHPSFREGSP